DGDVRRTGLFSRPGAEGQPECPRIVREGAYAWTYGTTSNLRGRGRPGAGDPLSHAVDHYNCYKAKLSRGASKLAKGTQVTVADPLTSPAKLFNVVAATHLYMPVDKNGEGAVQPSASLACYKLRSERGHLKHRKRTAVGINNQIGPSVIVGRRRS